MGFQDSASSPIEEGQIVQGYGDARVVGANAFFGHFKGCLAYNYRTRILTCPIKFFNLVIKDIPFDTSSLCEIPKGQTKEPQWLSMW